MTIYSTTITAISCLAVVSHAFVLPAGRTQSQLILHQLPDQAGGWMQDGETGTYTRPQQPTPRTDPGQPLARVNSGKDYYVQAPAPGISSDGWWSGAGSPNEPLFGGPSTTSPGSSYYPRTDGQRMQDGPRPETIQGAGSRRTYDTSQHDQTNFVLGSQGGRPVYANVQVWEGPNNTPASMSLYSEDGYMRPWSAGFQNTLRSGGSSALNIRNTGPMEFPVEASVEGTYDGTRGQLIGTQIKEQEQFAPTESLAKSKTIQGETLKTFSVGPNCQAIRVELFSEGRPMYAQVELWQGPNNIQQCAEIYSDNGNDRVWSAVIPTPGYACTLAIRNIGPMAYPISASVDAMVM